MDNGYYLYAVLQNEAGSDIDLDACGARTGQAATGGMGGRYELQRVNFRGLCAIYSEVPLSEFGQESLKQNMGNLEWLENAARRHDVIVRNLSALATIVPVRFGTVFLSLTGIEKFVDDYGTEITALLDKFDGCWEMGITLSFDKALVVARLEGKDDELRQLDTKIRQATEGAAYLFRKKLEQVQDAKFKLFVEEEVGACTKLLSQTARFVKEEPPGTNKDGGALLSVKLACLVPIVHIDRLRSQIELLYDPARVTGVFAAITGPWPPYTFSRLAKTAIGKEASHHA